MVAFNDGVEQRKGTLIVGVTAAGLLAIATLIGGGDHGRTPDPAPPPPSSTSTPSATPTATVTTTARTTQSNRDWADRRLAATIGAWPTPPGARGAVPSRLHWLRKQRWGVDIGTPFIRKGKSFLVEGDAADVLNWMRRHPAKGWGTGRGWGQLPDNSGGYSYGPPAGIVVHHRYFGVRPVDRPRAYLNVTVQTMQLGDQVAVRIDGVAVAAPVRPASSYLHHVTSVTFHQWEQTRGRWHPVASRTLRGPLATRLAREINRAQAWTGTQHSCPFAFWPHYRLLFHTPTGDLRADNFGGCLGLWALRVDGHRLKPELSTGYRLDTIARRIGVPTRT